MGVESSIAEVVNAEEIWAVKFSDWGLSALVTVKERQGLIDP